MMNIFDFIKSQIAILDVIQEYTTLKRAGVYWKGLCPFHGEKTGSFTVSPHRQIFYCFGCHASGDVIGFIAKIENLTQIEAAKFIAERRNLNLPEQSLNEQAGSMHNAKEHYFKLCQTVAEWCHLQLKQTSEAKAYLLKRKITEATINKFQLGYFPKGQNATTELTKYIQQKSFLLGDLLEANLLQRGQHGYFSGFEERIIFPIQDLLGRFCAFGGRVFKAGDERVKYYNSHEHNFFNKRATLFGISHAKKSIQSKHVINLVEGYMDCIAMHQAGFENTAATLGTACTTEQIDLVARLADEVRIIYDGDQAGLNAIERMTQLCWNANLEVKVVELPKGEDPASCLESDIKISSFLDKASDIYRFVIDQSSAKFTEQSLGQKFDASNKISEMIAKVHDPLKRDILLQHAAQKMGVTAKSLNQPKKELDPASQKEAAAAFDPLTEQVMLLFVVNPSKFTGKYHYLASYLPKPCGIILEKLISLNKEQAEVNMDHLLSILNEEEVAFVRRCLFTYNDTVAGETEQFQILDQFQRRHWRQVVRHIQNLLVGGNLDQGQVSQIIENFQSLKTELLSGGKSGYSK